MFKLNIRQNSLEVNKRKKKQLVRCNLTLMKKKEKKDVFKIAIKC